LKVTVLACPIGVLAFDEKNLVVERILFSKDPVATAEKLLKIESGKAIEEVTVLIKKLRERGYDQFIFENSGLADGLRKKMKIKAEVVKASEASNFLRERMEDLAVDLGFAKNREELKFWLHKVSMELARIRVKKAVEKRDLMVVHAILTIDDLDKTANLFMGRIREWYGLHFPELSKLVGKHETYARLVLNIGRKEDITQEKLEELGISREKAKKIVETARTSMGAELRDSDIRRIQLICKITLELYERLS